MDPLEEAALGAAFVPDRDAHLVVIAHPVLEVVGRALRQGPGPDPVTVDEVAVGHPDQDDVAFVLPARTGVDVDRGVPVLHAVELEGDRAFGVVVVQGGRDRPVHAGLQQGRLEDLVVRGHRARECNGGDHREDQTQALHDHHLL